MITRYLTNRPTPRTAVTAPRGRSQTESDRIQDLGAAGPGA
ncbi:hypothetical protein PYK79_07085 [Streptomyces sp. ID05-04B]|nr:hypothetical protein [Streptomyces sp. ID05-04B]